MKVVLQSHERRYIVAVYCRSRRLYYISIPPTVVARYVLAHLGRVMDMFVGYCSSLHRNMTAFDGNGPLDAESYEDFASVN